MMLIHEKLFARASFIIVNCLTHFVKKLTDYDFLWQKKVFVSCVQLPWQRHIRGKWQVKLIEVCTCIDRQTDRQVLTHARTHPHARTHARARARAHTHTHTSAASLSHTLSLSVSLCLCLLCLCFSVRLCLSVCLSLFLSPSACLPAGLPVCLSVCLSVSLSPLTPLKEETSPPPPQQMCVSLFVDDGVTT